MIEIMVDNSTHFLGAVADFLTSEIGLIFIGLFALISVVYVLKFLISFR